MTTFLKKKILPHYHAIIRRKSSPYHQVTKKIEVEAEGLSALNVDELWALHKEGMAKYRKLLNQPSEQREKSEKAGPNSSLFDVKVALAERILENCHFCERRCYKNRKIGELGTCGVGAKSFYASEFLHLGEEPELVPSHTIFFSGCNFSCCYCQNWDIATAPRLGKVVVPKDMARLIHVRHREGSKNVNFVGGNPDPHLLTILKIINEVKIGVPMIWNSNMYSSRETMSLLEGVIDLYLADFRYGNDQCAKTYSKVSNYFEVVSRNFKLAHDQADVILRHLVLPGHLECCTKPIMEWMAQNIPGVYFNLMFQYYPCYRASSYPEINRRLTLEERRRALELATETGIKTE